MVDENVDRVHAPGQQPTPERDIEPLWPPDQIGGTDTPPWASTASPSSFVPPQGRPGHPPSPADYPSLTGGVPLPGAETTAPQGANTGWSPPPATASGPPPGAVPASPPATVSGPPPAAVAGAAPAATSGWEPDASAWAPPAPAAQIPPVAPNAPTDPTVPPGPGLGAAGPPAPGPAGDRPVVGLGGGLPAAAGGGVPAPRPPQSGPARVDLDMPFSLDQPAAPVPVASAHSVATARRTAGPGEPTEGAVGRREDASGTAVAGAFPGGRPSPHDPAPGPGGPVGTGGPAPTGDTSTAAGPTTGRHETGGPTNGGPTNGGHEAGGPANGDPTNGGHEAGGPTNGDPTDGGTGGSAPGSAGGTANGGAGGAVTSGGPAHGGGARMPAESPWAQPPQRPATAAVEPGPGAGASDPAPTHQGAVPRQALHHQQPALRVPANHGPIPQGPAAQGPTPQGTAEQNPPQQAPAPPGAPQGPIPQDQAGQGAPVGPAPDPAAPQQGFTADPASRQSFGAGPGAAQQDFGGDPAASQQAAPPGPYPPQQAGPYPPQQGGPPGPYPPQQAGPYPPQQGATPPGPYPPGWYPPPWQQATPGAAAPQQAYQPAEGVTAVPPAQPDPNWRPAITDPPTAEDFARRRQVRPADPVATIGVRAVANRMGLRLPPGRHEQELRRDIETVRRNFGGLRQVTVVNPKGGAGKTVAILLLAMTFGQKRGGYVLAWDNNETQGTLGMRAQQDFHSRTVRDMLRDLGQFQGAHGRVGDLSQYVRSQGEGMFDVLASDESATGGEMLTAAAFAEIREVVSRFYKLIFVDTGNNVRAQNWQAAMDATDQLVVTMSARNDSAETAARMLDHLEQSGRQRLVRQAVTVVSMPPSRKEIDLPAIQEHFAARTRAVLLAPYERLIDTGEPIRYGGLSAATRDAWLKIAASVAEGL
ncbi:chromosome partitioning protein [Micromonospora sp. NPDC023633]|uniref:chromosome partitioning protein n=1 Tax=Micromonospora sp. NPDC023633 TaxID=3154320 RepID=UPI0033E4CD29